jgi:3-oxoacyl-[acyl-carrier protein] reductase
VRLVLPGLEGRRVLVTGASKGIGAACARMLAAAGAHVGVHYHLGKTGAEAVAEDVRRAGCNACILQADLSVWHEGERIVAEAEATLGPLDGVVLNHGIWKEAAIDRMTAAQYDETMDANLRGIFSVAGAAVRRMKPRGRGRIVTIASTAGQRGEALHAHYAASKGAIIAFTKSLSTELVQSGILVNCVAPGWVRTPMTDRTLDDPTERAKVHEAIPMGRVGTPEEIAGPVVFLMSDLSTFMTGEIVNVNGGAVLCG